MFESDRPCFVIAEIGVNHNGSMELAHKLIDMAAEAKADAVKFQTFRAEDLVTRAAAKAAYQEANTGEGGSQFDMLRALEVTEEQFVELNRHCQQAGITFISTPFGPKAADLLERIGVDIYKVSSGDLTYLDFLTHLGRKGRPIILSTGMGTLSETEEALEAIYASGNREVSLLHCVSNYPAAPEDCNLAAIETMSAAFGVPVGWSDHTMGSAVSWAAVARGARIIEKHVTLDRTLPGPDHAASMEPDEFTAFMEGIRAIESAIGDGRKIPSEAERNTAEVARRSITAARDLPSGHQLTLEDLRVIRPGTGLAPRNLDWVVGSRLARDVAAETPLTLEDFHG